MGKWMLEEKWLTNDGNIFDLGSNFGIKETP